MVPRKIPLNAAIKLPVPLGFEVHKFSWKPGQGEILACMFHEKQACDVPRVKIYNLEKPETLAVDIKCGKSIWQSSGIMEWSDSGKLLAIGSESKKGDIKLCNSDGSEVGRLFPRNDLSYHIKFNNSGTLAIVFILDDDFFEVLDVDTGASLHEMRLDGDISDFQLAMRLDGDISDFQLAIVWKDERDFFTCDDDDQTIKLWRVGQEIPLKTIPGYYPMAWNPRSGILAFNSEDDSDSDSEVSGGIRGIKLWTPDSANSDITILGEHRAEHRYQRAAFFWSPASSCILASLEILNEGIKIWDTATGANLYSFQDSMYDFRGEHSFSFSPGGHSFAYACGGSTEHNPVCTNVNVRNTETGELLVECEGGDPRWSPEGDKLAVMQRHDQERIFIFNMKTSSLKTLALIKVASCIKNNLERSEIEKEEILKELELPKSIKPEMRLYL